MSCKLIYINVIQIQLDKKCSQLIYVSFFLRWVEGLQELACVRARVMP